MERLTSNKEASDMSMIELAHNSCYADDKRNARYRDYEMDMDARDFARSLMVTLAKDEMPISDTEFDEEILDNLAIDTFSDVRGLIALFYRNLWAMANLRETLKAYEDLEEQGKLVKLPCNRGDKIYFIKSAFSMAHFPIEARITSICGIDCDSDVMYSSITEYNKIDRRFKSSDIGKTVFLTKSEAEAKLKELRCSND